MNKNKKNITYSNDNKCIMCGVTIPEGLMICPQCQNKINKKNNSKEC